jgi:hypothetical protein
MLPGGAPLIVGQRIVEKFESQVLEYSAIHRLSLVPLWP